MFTTIKTETNYNGEATTISIEATEIEVFDDVTVENLIKKIKKSVDEAKQKSLLLLNSSGYVVKDTNEVCFAKRTKYSAVQFEIAKKESQVHQD